MYIYLLHHLVFSQVPRSFLAIHLLMISILFVNLYKQHHPHVTHSPLNCHLLLVTPHHLKYFFTIIIITITNIAKVLLIPSVRLSAILLRATQILTGLCLSSRF